MFWVTRSSFRVDVTSFKELLQLEAPITRQARRLTRELKSPPRERLEWRLGTQPNHQLPYWIFPSKPCDTKLKNDWLSSFNKRQLVEWNTNQALFSLNNVQHIALHISTLNITWYPVQHLSNRICELFETLYIRKELKRRSSLSNPIYTT